MRLPYYVRKRKTNIKWYHLYLESNMMQMNIPMKQ